MSDPWWTCDHGGIGLPGCPTCDAMLTPRGKRALREARDEIAARGAERDQLAADLAGARAALARLYVASGADTDGNDPTTPAGIAHLWAHAEAEVMETLADLRNDAAVMAIEIADARRLWVEVSR